MRITAQIMLVFLFTFTWLINDTTHLLDMPLNNSEHKVHQSVDTITNSEVILETVRSTITNSANGQPFYPIDILLTCTVHLRPLISPSQFTISAQFIGFISVVQHQSNYLP